MSIQHVLFPQVDVDHAENPVALIRAGVIAIILLLVCIAAWLAAAPLNGAAIAPGLVKVDMNRKVVQHQEGGIVGEIRVRDGQKVKAGETLLVLKDVRVNATNDLVQTQLDAELAKAARLSSEQVWAPEVIFPQELRSREQDPRIAELLAKERGLFRARRGAYESQVTLIKKEIRDTQQEIVSRDQQLAADARSIALQREELEANEALTEQGFVSKTKLLGFRRNLADLEARMSDSDAERARALQKISDLELKAETLRTSLMQDAASELQKSTAQIFDLRERLRPTQDAEERQRITAPIDGEVVDLKVTTVGAVIGPREPIMDIVPDQADLIVEVRVRPEDISSVRPDAPADVRLTAFKQRLTPTVKGKVTYVSADRLTDKDGKTSYYVAHVRVTPEALKQAGDLRLQAGMPAEVFIQTKARTALNYMLDPLTSFMLRGMREP